MTRFVPRDHDFERYDGAGFGLEGIEKGLCGCRTDRSCLCYEAWRQALTMCYCVREECVCTTEMVFRGDS